MNWLKKLIVEWLNKWAKASTPKPPVAQPTATKPEIVTCKCDLNKPILEPVKGSECPMPWGMDIRFLAWSPSEKDWVFIGHRDGLCAHDGKQITGLCECVDQDGGRYHYIGYRAPKSEGPLISEQAGTYQETYRLYFEKR